MSRISVFRANKELQNGVEASVQALSSSLRISGLLRVSKLWMDEKSMRDTCSALGSHSHTSRTTRKKRYVILLRVVIPPIDAACGCAQKGSGLFQSEIILSTLSLHFAATNTLKDDMRSTENPRGALLLSVVAVRYFP
jgi:hypothetical protein